MQTERRDEEPVRRRYGKGGQCSSTRRGMHGRRREPAEGRGDRQRGCIMLDRILLNQTLLHRILLRRARGRQGYAAALGARCGNGERCTAHKNQRAQHGGAAQRPRESAQRGAKSLNSVRHVRGEAGRPVGSNFRAAPAGLDYQSPRKQQLHNGQCEPCL